MLDYVDLVSEIKIKMGLQDRAVIVGGGSYGGMLAAWLRMKYPQWFQGALASSAPILFFEGKVDPEAYDELATNDYKGADPDCPTTISAGFTELATAATEASTYPTLKEIFALCDAPTQASDV